MIFFLPMSSPYGTGDFAGMIILMVPAGSLVFLVHFKGALCEKIFTYSPIPKQKSLSALANRLS